MDTMYEQLLEAVTEKALKDRTIELIAMKSRGAISSCRGAFEEISSYPIGAVTSTAPSEPSDRRMFLTLIKFYHPDRHCSLAARVRKAFEERDESLLEAFGRVFLKDERLQGTEHSGIHYRESYAHQREDMSESYSFEDVPYRDMWIREAEEPMDFISAAAAVCVGNSGIRFDLSDLSHLSGALDLSGFGIDDLSGIEHCSSLERIDLSGNSISNIYDLQYLTSLTELDLSENDLDDISWLSTLQQLTLLDISGNRIEDVSELLSLPSLEYVNLSGNPCVLTEKGAIDILERRGVIVISFGVS